MKKNVEENNYLPFTAPKNSTSINWKLSGLMEVVIFELPVMLEPFPVKLKIISTFKILPRLFPQLNWIVKLTWFVKEQGVKALSKFVKFINWRVTAGKVKFSGKFIGLNFRFKIFKGTVRPRSICRFESLNLIGSSNFFSHLKELQFDIGDGTSNLKIMKEKCIWIRAWAVELTLLVKQTKKISSLFCWIWKKCNNQLIPNTSA